MQSIEIIETNAQFKKYLVELFDLMNLDYSTFTDNDVSRRVNYVVLNSINERYKVLDGDYCFINMDLISKMKNNVDISGCIITYGLGSKNTVTISSLDYSSGFVYCLQRDIIYEGKRVIEAQEIPVNMALKDIDELYAAVVAITIGLMEDKCIYDLIKNKTFMTLS
ncbi:MULTISPECIES: hypothetical protein [Clostridium]|uniref:Uncharacterized protein n=2 Tax=Clostridium TaxID=1485 RepID=D8GSC2_CLOLD|nr:MULTISPECIES: hypothetical protein [Clostridium]ADK16504.1 conserved hypothetical protein [Clostridium ljungdahlii DSM 13528]OAA89627.1 hypothetical protein WX45_01459 [Clostridium ljungdahlii DSM 13528]RMC97864.1 hypothetical protein D9O40_13880 [Clostridium autoethanogenum]